MAKELTRLNASAKGFRSQFVNTRNVLVQALPLYNDGATASRQGTICIALDKIGLQADKVHNAYQRLIKSTPMSATTTTSMTASNSLAPSTTI
jgi:hypothetical protein